ncbi:uncharacterized protein LOC111291139 isoform X2 [Durio zibethinus]|uniref:Uncharacterized protein LOC111291139 isoform X2 n=1 Tax=Durio zibethinus TaxID=66656 RepID=A0A6P5YDP1_DURZI|nr:uncharacterized protein LOC111291139 isoform X2 [Durio zibethinus]
MHSLSLKVFTDLNAGTRRNRFPGRVGQGLSADLHFGGKRRVGSGCWDGGVAWKCRIVACAVERNGNGGGGESPSLNPNPTRNESSFLSRSQTYAMLKHQMEVAAKSEDYKEAARIRDSLKMLEEEEPILRLRRLIKEAVADERFEGIRVQVRSVYVEGRSIPSRDQYVFAYRIRIINNSDRPVQLLRRHWIITDGNGKTESVWGIGVIGKQPVILPRTGFEYLSACPLSTPNGRMEGDFEMKHIDRVGTPSFNVAIAPFSLSTLGDDAGTF